MELGLISRYLVIIKGAPVTFPGYGTLISEVVFMVERGNFDEKRWKLGICLVVRRDNSGFHPLHSSVAAASVMTIISTRNILLKN